ncbi:DsbA family protein [Lentzea sp. PSKA42]|uniref:DsbA family protein n=1 Tax=Lentzea indica TaxID=2604800 RepID=A0ABX1FRD8_9PSEU|nr:DsbA family protein [Lentzea indica]NKE61517.1 DsbA family protein [Lentzea indica]
MKLVYVFDAYCGWSHAFSGTLQTVTARHPELPVEVISGGLFTGERRVPIREFGFIKDANVQVTARTGAKFGDAFNALLDEGTFVMDSEAAARGLIALRQAAPDRAAELAVAMQNAYFHHGRSLSDPDTYRMIAEDFGFDADAVVAAFESASPEAEFGRAARLGVSGFPTLIAVRGSEMYALARGHASADEIEQRLEALSRS